MFKRLAVSLTCSLLLSNVAGAHMINVPADVASITAGIATAKDGDTVLIAPGKYNEGINFNGKKITVAGNFLLTGDRSAIGTTIVYNNIPKVIYDENGDQILTEPTEPVFAVEFSGEENGFSVLTGIEIRDMRIEVLNLSSPVIKNVRVVGSGEYRGSSLILQDSASIPLSNIEFIYSHLSLWSRVDQVMVSSNSFNNSDISCNTGCGTVTINDNEFVNSSIGGGGTGHAEDSIIITSNSFKSSTIHLLGTGNITISAVISGNSFSDEPTPDLWTRPSIDFGGTGNLLIESLIEDNTFSKTGISMGGTGYATIKTTILNNTFNGDGGTQGISCGGTGFCTVAATVDSNRFIGANFSIGGTGVFTVNANLVRNIFTRFNGKAIDLDRMALSNYTLNLVNNTIVGNTTGVSNDNVGGLIIVNCIIRDNENDLVNVREEQITYSLWETGLTHSGSTNVFGDPMLIDPDNLDFGLRAGSPCIGKGSLTPFSFNNRNYQFGETRDIGAIPYRGSTIILDRQPVSEIKNSVPGIRGALLTFGSLGSALSDVHFYNVSGRLVRSIRLTRQAEAVDLRSLSLCAGSYAIRVTGSNGNTSTLLYLQK